MNSAIVAGDLAEVKRIEAECPGTAKGVITDVMVSSSMLNVATCNKRYEIAEFLIKSGADIDHPEFSGCTPLCNATEVGDVRIVRLLLRHKARVDIRDLAGYTALHAASQNGSTAIAAMLVARGAAVNARSNTGETPLRLALRAGQKSTAALLRRNGGRL